MTSNIPTWYNQLLRKKWTINSWVWYLNNTTTCVLLKKVMEDDLSSAVHWSLKSEVTSQKAVKHMVFFTSWVHTVEAPLEDPNCWITTRKSQLVPKLCRFIQTAGWGGRALLPEKQSLQFSRVFLQSYWEALKEWVLLVVKTDPWLCVASSLLLTRWEGWWGRPLTACKSSSYSGRASRCRKPRNGIVHIYQLCHRDKCCR